MTIFGYARVSTDGQSLSAQIAQLTAAGCDKVFREKISGARADRNQLERLLKIVERNDLVIVTRLDRLARSTRDLLNILGTLAESGVGFRSLSDTCIKNERYGQALDFLDRAQLRLEEETSERFYAAEIYRLLGETHLRSNRNLDQAEHYFFKGLKVAREQKAKSFELKICLSMVPPAVPISSR